MSCAYGTRWLGSGLSILAVAGGRTPPIVQEPSEATSSPGYLMDDSPSPVESPPSAGRLVRQQAGASAVVAMRCIHTAVPQTLGDVQVVKRKLVHSLGPELAGSDPRWKLVKLIGAFHRTIAVPD